MVVALAGECEDEVRREQDDNLSTFLNHAARAVQRTRQLSGGKECGGRQPKARKEVEAEERKLWVEGLATLSTRSCRPPLRLPGGFGVEQN